MGKPVKVWKNLRSVSDIFFVASAPSQKFSLQCYPHKELGGGHYQKFFCKDVWSEPGNLYQISDQHLRVFILLFRQEPKINTPSQISKISTQLLYVSAVNRNWVPFVWTFERGTNLPTSMRKKWPFFAGKTKYPMPSQREKHTLYQTKMVKIYALFQTKIAKKTFTLWVPDIPKSGSITRAPVTLWTRRK